MQTHPSKRILRLAAVALLVATVPFFLVLIVLGPVDGKGDPGQGFWGEKTATVNWCEADYVVTPYIAEFGNTMSSILIIWIGLYGIFKHRKVIDRRYLVSLFFFIIVGSGSAAFHGTLWRSMQLMDELPMVWINSVFIYILISLEDPEGKVRAMEAFALVGMTILMTSAVILFDKKDQNIFLLCYAGGVAYITYRTWKFDTKYNSKGSVVFLELAVLFYIGGLFVWLLDRAFCPYVRSFHLHSFWHFGAGTGTYAMVLCWIWMRMEFWKVKPIVRGYAPLQFIEPTDKVV